MPEESTTFTDRLNRTKEKMGELSKKATEATKKATQATVDALEKTSTQIQTAVEDTKMKIEEKRDKKIQEKKDAITGEELMGDSLSMVELPQQNEQLAIINENQNEVISELTEHMIMLSNRIDQIENKIFAIQSIELQNFNEKSEKNTQISEHRSQKAIASVLQLLGASLIWVVILFGIDSYLSDYEIASNYPPSIIIWGIGAWTWSLYLLRLIGKNVPALNLSFAIRMQISLSLGFITSISIILSTDYISTVSNIWMWVLIAASAMLLGGSMIASAWRSTKNLVTPKTIEN